MRTDIPAQSRAPEYVDEWRGKGDTPEANTGVIGSMPSPPASDVEEAEMPLKQTRLCSPTCAQEATTSLIDTLFGPQLTTECIEIILKLSRGIWISRKLLGKKFYTQEFEAIDQGEKWGKKLGIKEAGFVFR